MTSELSVVLLVRNEIDRLPLSLATVSWADEVVVVDTGSTDGTREMAAHRGARVVEIPWEGYVTSRNRALGFATHDWVLVLDADEHVTPALRDAIRKALGNGAPFDGYWMPRLSHFLGKPIRHGTWYPDRKLRLGRRSKGFRAEGGRVHEWMAVDGPAGHLDAALIHYPYRNLSDVLRKASDYARLGALDRFEKGIRGSAFGLVLRPAFEFVRCYVLKRGFLDGRAGFGVAFFHASSYFLRAAYLLDLERGGRPARGAKGAGEGVNQMKRGSLIFAAAVLGTAACAVLTACKKEGTFEKAGRKADEAVGNVSQEMEEAAKNARERLHEAKEKAAETTKAVSQQAEEAGRDVEAKAKKAAEVAKETAEDLKKQVSEGVEKAKDKTKK